MSTTSSDASGRPVRKDAARTLEALLQAAPRVFERSGVDAPVREIAAEAGVGVATMYRHFPKRSDLLSAIFRSEVDACAAQSPRVAAAHPDDPGAALRDWLHRYVDFLIAKRGLGSLLRTDPVTFSELHAYFDARLEPALDELLTTAVASGACRDVLGPRALLYAIRGLCISDGTDDDIRTAVDVLIDGLRRS